MSARFRKPAVAVVLACSVSGRLSADDVVLRVDVAEPAAEIVATGTDVARAEISVPPGTTSVPVEVDIVLVSRFERCVTNPEECTGGEIRPVPQCGDGVDNDGDGRADFDDPDCVGVQGYAISVATDPSFHLRPEEGPEEERGVSFVGTVSDDDTRPPGRAHPPILRYVDVIDPARNGGQEGLVGVCTLSLTTFVILPPLGEWPILKVRGDLDVSTLKPGESSAPCRIDIRGPGEAGLTLGAAPTTTEIVVNGLRHPHAVRDLEIVARIAPPAPFKRGEANGDGALDISDALFIVSYLFLGGRTPACLDSADTDDSGEVDVSDSIRVFRYLFFGAQAPPQPGPGACGLDPTADSIHCAAFSGC
jgi:hypothetical protein